MSTNSSQSRHGNTMHYRSTVEACAATYHYPAAAVELPPLARAQTPPGYPALPPPRASRSISFRTSRSAQKSVGRSRTPRTRAPEKSVGRWGTSRAVRNYPPVRWDRRTMSQSRHRTSLGVTGCRKEIAKDRDNVARMSRDVARMSRCRGVSRKIVRVHKASTVTST